MPSPAKATTATVIPCLRYRDAQAAIDWLIRAFGMEKHFVYALPDGFVPHAQLTFGNGMIMLSTATKAGDFGELIVQPDEVNLAETQAPCLIVADAQAIYDTATAAGATIVKPLETMPYGGKAFTCRDLEGHLWSIGEYDPWAPQ